MPQNIKVYSGRLKKVRFTWRQGVSSSSPPIDLTGATVEVQDSKFPVKPSVNVLDAVNGVCELVFEPEVTESKRGIYWVLIALTFTSDPGYSPDPVWVEVAVQPQ